MANLSVLLAGRVNGFHEKLEKNVRSNITFATEIAS